MDKTVLMTMTGEIFQPVRVYYDLFDRERVIKALSKFRTPDLDF